MPTFFRAIKKWVDCGIGSIGQLLGPNGYLIIMNLKQNFRLLTLFVIGGYTGCN